MIQKETKIKGIGKAEAQHRVCQEWISTVLFAQDELSFINKLLHSYVFEPTTPNLYERLQDYIGRLELAKAQLAELNLLIHDHEKQLGGLLEYVQAPEDLEFDREHEQLWLKTKEVLGKFGMLKSEIFNYAGGILKKRKSWDEKPSTDD